MNTKFLSLSILTLTLSLAYAEIEDGLVSYWTLDAADVEAPVVRDAYGTNDGEFVSNPTPVAGIIEEALEFDGATTSVEVPHPTDGSLDFGTSGDLTISAWIKTEALVETTIVSKGDGGTNSRILFKVDNLGRLFLTLSAPGGTPTSDFRSNSTVNDGEWHHVVLRADRDVGIGAYIDGQLDAEGGITEGTDLNSSSNLRIGASIRPGGATRRYFDGSIDDVAIWNRALDPEEIATLHTNGRDGKGVTGGSSKPFAIISIVPTRGEMPEVTVTWRSKAGAQYAVDRSPDLKEWLELDDGVNSTGEETSFTDRGDVGTFRTLFYRVREP